MSGITFVDSNFELHDKGGDTVNYQAARLSTSGDPLYNGFLANDGSWLIMERNIAAGTIKYVRGASAFSTAWTNKATQTYVEYSELFA